MIRRFYAADVVREDGCATSVTTDEEYSIWIDGGRYTLADVKELLKCIDEAVKNLEGNIKIEKANVAKKGGAK